MNVVHQSVHLKESSFVCLESSIVEVQETETAEEHDWDLNPWCLEETCIGMRSSGEQSR